MLAVGEGQLAAVALGRAVPLEPLLGAHPHGDAGVVKADVVTEVGHAGRLVGRAAGDVARDGAASERWGLLAMLKMGLAGPSCTPWYSLLNGLSSVPFPKPLIAFM